MPKGVVKNTEKKVSKRVAAAERKNKKAIASVMLGEAENVVFARVEKTLGCGGFSLLMNDGSTGIGLVRRTTCRVSLNSIVMCSAAEHNRSAKVQSYEILAVLCTAEAKKLMKDNGDLRREIEVRSLCMCCRPCSFVVRGGWVVVVVVVVPLLAWFLCAHGPQLHTRPWFIFFVHTHTK